MTHGAGSQEGLAGGQADGTVWTALLAVCLPLLTAVAAGRVDLERWQACAPDPVTLDLDAGGRFAVTITMVVAATAAYALVPVLVVVVRRLAPARSPGWAVAAACALAMALSVLWWGSAQGCAGSGDVLSSALFAYGGQPQAQLLRHHA